jgi:excisionase family DNA binding protein
MWYAIGAMSTSTSRITWTGAPAPRVADAPSDPGWHLLSIREVAVACQLSDKAVRRAIDDGELPAVKLRSRLRVTPEDFQAWIAASRRGGARRTAPPRRRAPRRAPAGTFRSLMQSELEL